MWSVPFHHLDSMVITVYLEYGGLPFFLAIMLLLCIGTAIQWILLWI